MKTPAVGPLFPSRLRGLGLKARILAICGLPLVLTAVITALVVHASTRRFVEDAIGEQMVMQARIVSHLVAIAERPKPEALSREEIDGHLKDIARFAKEHGNYDYEFWVTDSAGKVVLGSTGIEFTFSPEQGQAGAFLPLLDKGPGHADVVVQESRKREIDSLVYKYVGTTGVDMPRIVEVGYKTESVLANIVGKNLLLAAVVAGLLLAVGVVAFGALRSIVTTPIDELVRATEAVDAGKYRIGMLDGVRARGDELGRLASVFEVMVVNVEQQRKNEQLAAAHKRELEMAVRVQSQLIPTRLPQHPGWDFAASWQPAREVSGDYYDFVPKQGQLGLVIADVSGKGMHAALFMASTRSILRARASLPLATTEIVSQANTLLCEDAAQGMFVTLCYAELEPGSGRLKYVNCGHNPPLWYRAETRAVRELDPTAPCLGVLEPLECEERRLELGRGDVLLFYTDGFTEAFDEREQQFGEERLAAALRERAQGTPAEILAEIQARLDAFVGSAAQSDDRTIVIVKCV